MAVTRVGNIALYNNTIKDVSDLQKKLATLQTQISSGIKAQDFTGLSGQVEQFTQLEAKMRTAEKYKQSNSVNLARLNTTDQAMGQLVDIADSMENLIVQSRSGALGSAISVEQVMRGYLDQMKNALNINFEGRYLFGGTETAVAPVDDIQGTPAAIGIPEDGYYEGAKQSITYKQDERSQYDFPIRADDPSFQKIIAAAHQAIQAANAGNSDMLGQALTLMQQGQAELVNSRSRVSYTILNVETANDTLSALTLYWKGVTEDIAKTDIVAASTEVANHEATLQAAFSVYARLSQLRLTDYL